MIYFHNIEYRHLLRTGAYQNWAEHANRIDGPWDRLYQSIKNEFIAAGLDITEFSEAHTAIIADKLGFTRDFLINAYHGKETRDD